MFLSRSGQAWLILAVTMGFLLVVLFLMVSWMPPPEASSEVACAANMRVISGALELYEERQRMKAVPWQDLGDPASSSCRLIVAGCLKQPVRKPLPDCSYNISREPGGAMVSCVIHGDIRHCEEERARKRRLPAVMISFVRRFWNHYSPFATH